jgi:hypothetical protein
MKIIEFIKSNPNWRELLVAEPYNLIINDDGGFIMLKYSQMNSDFNNEMVRECRGLILDSSFAPVCVPFYKFGNYGESYAAEIDWDTAVVEEKVDGSLIKLWNYNGSWIVSTNGTIFAHKAGVGAQETRDSAIIKNYRDLFQAAADNAGLKIESLNPRYTYMFELVSPYNRVIVPYNEIDLYHIGTRDRVLLAETDVDIGVKKPKIYNCDSLFSLIQMASQLKYSEEGYVVRDKDYNRIKVKSPAYVAVSHFISGMNDKRLIDLIKTGESDEFLSYFPEYKSAIDGFIGRINNIADYLNGIIQTQIDGKEYASRKELAEVAQQTLFPAFIFLYYDGKSKNPLEWLRSLPSDKTRSKCSLRRLFY